MQERERVRGWEWSAVPVELLAGVAVRVIERYEVRSEWVARACPCCGGFVHGQMCLLAEAVRLADG